MKDETVPIRDSRGKKLCEIYFPWSWKNFLGERRVWIQPDKIVKLVWHQALIIMLGFLKFQTNMFPLQNSFYDLITSIKEHKTGFPCVACGGNSMFPTGLFNRVIGFKCQNRNCSMYNVLHPAILLSYLYEMPLDFQREFQHMIVMNKGGSDKNHWGNYTVLEVEGQWSDINDTIVKGAREGDAYAISLLESLSKGDS